MTWIAHKISATGVVLFALLCLPPTAAPTDPPKKDAAVTPLRAGFADPAVSLPPKVEFKPGQLVRIEAKTSFDNCVFDWPEVLGGDEDVEIIGGKRIIFPFRPGTYQIRAWVSADNKPVKSNLCIVVIQGGPTPGPLPPPIPPSPEPPAPPPDPAPAPAPIPAEGFRVLIVYESGELARLPRDQHAILTSKRVRDYLNEKCVRVGGTPDWRVFDKDVDLANESDLWRKTMGRPRTTLPWLVISGSKGGFEGPLPSSVDAMMELLRKHGG